jgi:DNA-binding CsgD family transcriptional regulator
MDRLLALPLIQSIYEATLDVSRWQQCAEGLSQAFGNAPTGIALQPTSSPAPGLTFSTGFEPRFRSIFTDHARRGLPWESGRRSNFVGRFGLASEVISEERLRATDFYRDVMLPQGLGPHSPISHTIALREGRPVASLAIFATRETGPFGESHLAFGDLLAPHLALGYQLLVENRRHQALSDAIDRFPTGVALLDASGQVLLANRGARRIFEQNDGIALDAAALRAASSRDDIQLRSAVATAVKAGVEGRLTESAVLSVSRRSGGRPYAVMVGALRPRTGGPTAADAVVVLYVADLEHGALRRREALRELYGLTEAETQLVELLCQGSSLDQAAGARGVTMNTARSQLKQVFAKTHTSRQSELVRLVISGVASIAGP